MPELVCQQGHRTTWPEDRPWADEVCPQDQGRWYLDETAPAPAPPAPAQPPPPAAEQPPRPAAGAASVALVTLTLRSPRGEALAIEVAPGEQIVIGRDPAWSPHAAFLADWLGVSRRHATIGLDADGRAWLRHDGTTNLTRVDGLPVTAGAVRQLSGGETVVLSSEVTGRVILTPGRARG
jgi:pSer/pThr/pTyr-binding forkhead associated (FHA) protein